jgi:hypothetical protein
MIEFYWLAVGALLREDGVVLAILLLSWRKVCKCSQPMKNKQGLVAEKIS